MFVRKRENKTGSFSVQVVQKRGRRNVVVATIGCSSSDVVVAELMKEGELYVQRASGQLQLDFDDERKALARAMLSIQEIRSTGLEQLLGRIYCDIGFDALNEQLFKWLVLARIVKPVSKLATTEYLNRHHNYGVNVQAIYRFLDKLDEGLKDEVHRIAFDHTKSVLGGDVNVVFYDVTTLYFETALQDDLRVPGYSKDGKSQNPQILLGLLVAEHGYPIAYDIFEGNKFEGHTMLPVIDELIARFKLQPPIVVADAGLMNRSNIEMLEQKDYRFILGARIKNLPKALQTEILSLKLKDGESTSLKTSAGHRLVISYSSKRAKKDAKDRERGIERAQKLLERDNLTKEKLSNHGYKKFITIQGQATLKLDKAKIREAARWDGLKGYLTNTELDENIVMAKYSDLWEVERSFRITKHDLEARPMFHRVERRIRAHICVCFAALKVKKELERQLKVNKAPYSTDQAIAIAERIFSIKNTVPGTGEIVEVMRFENHDQRRLATLFNFEIPEGNRLAGNLGV